MIKRLEQLMNAVLEFVGFGLVRVSSVQDFCAIAPRLGSKKVSVRVIAKELGISSPRSARARNEVFRVMNQLGLRAECLDNPKHIRLASQTA